MRLVDTHTHLNSSEFGRDIEAVVDRARKAGISRFYIPGIDSSTIDSMLQLESLYPQEVFPMMGIHPCSVNKNYLGELKFVEDFFKKRKFVAVGEIGLDFYWDTTYKEEQFDAFNKQMQLALDYQVPIVIHTRNAMAETLEAVAPFAAKGLSGIFHCFGDSYDTAMQIIDMGFYLGIGGVLTYKNAGLPENLKNVPLERMVLETDAPYLPPVPYRGKRNETSYLTYIATKLADVKGVTTEDVAEVTTANALKIFGA